MNRNSDLGEAFNANQSFGTVFTRPQLVDLGRIVLNRVAATPAMITGPDTAVKEVVKAVAAAMAADEKLL